MVMHQKCSGLRGLGFRAPGICMQLRYVVVRNARDERSMSMNVWTSKSEDLGLRYYTILCNVGMMKTI